jgi:hypothetical protein
MEAAAIRAAIEVIPLMPSPDLCNGEILAPFLSGGNRHLIDGYVFVTSPN